MKKTITTMLGLAIATSSFAAINSVKNEKGAKEQLEKLGGQLIDSSESNGDFYTNTYLVKTGNFNFDKDTDSQCAKYEVKHLNDELDLLSITFERHGGAMEGNCNERYLDYVVFKDANKHSILFGYSNFDSESEYGSFIDVDSNRILSDKNYTGNYTVDLTIKKANIQKEYISLFNATPYAINFSLNDKIIKVANSRTEELALPNLPDLMSDSDLDLEADTTSYGKHASLNIADAYFMSTPIVRASLPPSWQFNLRLFNG